MRYRYYKKESQTPPRYDLKSLFSSWVMKFIFVLLPSCSLINLSYAGYYWTKPGENSSGHTADSCDIVRNHFPFFGKKIRDYYRDDGCDIELVKPKVFACRVTSLSSTGGCGTQSLRYSDDNEQEESESLGDSCASAGSPSPTAGNPITLLNGNKFQKEVDYMGSRLFPLNYTRYYNSHIKTWTTLASLRRAGDTLDFENHSDNVGSYVYIDSEISATVYTPAVYATNKPAVPFVFSKANGKQYWFNQLANGSWQADKPATGVTLIELTNTSGLVGYRITLRNKTEYDFDAARVLTKVSRPGGLFHTYSRQVNQNVDTLVISHSLGGELTITLNEYGLAKELTTPEGNVIKYDYHPTRLRLNSVERVLSAGQSTFRTYHYQDYTVNQKVYKNYLVGITDERGVRYATWAYEYGGGKLRASRSEHAGGKEIALVDSSNIFSGDSGFNSKVIVTNTHNKKTVYWMKRVNERQVITRVEGEASANCLESNSYYSYYANGTRQTKTDASGNVTYYERDNSGRVTLKRQGYHWSGATKSGLVTNVLSQLVAPSAPDKLIETRTCWNDTHSKPERMIEADRVTRYEYFPSGQLKKQTVEKRTSANDSCL